MKVAYFFSLSLSPPLHTAFPLFPPMELTKASSETHTVVWLSPIGCIITKFWLLTNVHEGQWLRSAPFPGANIQWDQMYPEITQLWGHAGHTAWFKPLLPTYFTVGLTTGSTSGGRLRMQMTSPLQHGSAHTPRLSDSTQMEEREVKS